MIQAPQTPSRNLPCSARQISTSPQGGGYAAPLGKKS
jgi:hypothetical protein